MQFAGCVARYETPLASMLREEPECVGR